MNFRRILLPAISLWLTACAAPTSGVLEAGFPRPAGMEDSEEGEEGQERRAEWVESMHRAGPGVDWRAIEDENRRVAMEHRNQQQGQRSVSSGAWDEVGSRNLAGSTFVAAPSSNGLELYVGTSLGGLFRGPQDGSAWTAIGDNAYGGAHLVTVVPPASGSQDILLRAVSGKVLRSADGGTTWTVPSGFVNLGEVRRLICLSDATRTVLLLGKQGSVWRVWRSTDRGQSFTISRYIIGSTADLWTPRDALGPVYLFEQNRLSISTDGGANFAGMGSPLSFSATDLRFGGHESSGNTVFSVAARHGSTWELWRSTNSGNTWTYKRDMPEMWSAFGTSITNDQVICYGGVELWVSFDGGASFAYVNPWWEHPGNRQFRLHADIMGVSAIPDASLPSGERWYVNTHGGTYESKTQLDKVNWLSAVGLGVGQYYATHTSRRDPKYLHVGSQDQGYQRSVLGTPGGGGPWADFTELITGDYGHLSSANGSHDLVYSDYPGFVLVCEGEAAPVLRTVNFPAGFDGQWLPYLVADPENAEVFYLLGSKIWRYERTSTTTWAYSQLSAQSFSPVLSALSFSPLDPLHAWCVSTDGKIYHSADRGVTWTQSASTGPGAHYFYGTTIVPSSRNLDEVWIAGSGYSAAPVKFSSDRGVTWTARRTGLPDTLIYGLCEGVDGSGRMYAASETGAWEWDPTTQTWSDILGVEAPLTLYWSVESIPSQNLIRFGTYGRGVWDYAPGTPGFFPYGELRGAPNVLHLSASGPPLIGQSATLSLNGAAPLASGFLMVCAAAADAPMFGGWRLVDSARLVARVPLSTNSSGAAQLVVSIPNAPALIGAERFLQAAVRDPSQVQGWSLSHGLRARIGQ